MQEEEWRMKKLDANLSGCVWCRCVGVSARGFRHLTLRSVTGTPQRGRPYQLKVCHRHNPTIAPDRHCQTFGTAQDVSIQFANRVQVKYKF